MNKLILLLLAKYSRHQVNTLIEQLDSKLCLGPPSSQDGHFHSSLKELLSMSFAGSTWNKYCSAWRAWLDFQSYVGETVTFPVDIVHFRKFAIWCTTVRKISDSTTWYYMHSVQIAHSIRGVPCVDFGSDKIFNMLLNGAKNFNSEHSYSSTRRVMTFATLLLISHNIASCDWLDISKQVLWSACSLAFFSSEAWGTIE
jgi:hypothetical protein